MKLQPQKQQSQLQRKLQACHSVKIALILLCCLQDSKYLHHSSRKMTLIHHYCLQDLSQLRSLQLQPQLHLQVNYYLRKTKLIQLYCLLVLRLPDFLKAVMMDQCHLP
uniref:Uncharacterized protein n=1 Tax=Megaselia scalaris TaxID=36166 RepID=T1GXS9_MEGSC